MGADADSSPPRYLAGGLSEKGRRESNEDAAILAVLPASPALRAFAVLSDGMGGHNAGEVASRITVEVLREKVRLFSAREDAASLQPAALEAEIRGWIDEVNREIYERGKASAEQKGMGATVAFAMVLPDDRLVVANVGDSKVFHVSGLKVRQLSVDHTALAEQRRALGSDAVAPEDDSGNPFAHALTRSLGQEKKVVPDVRCDVILGAGDAVVLTTDGVTDVLEAERFLTALEASGSLQETADEIYRLALEAGTKDNVSVAILSRGTPARLGLGKTGQVPAVTAPGPGGEEEGERGGDTTLVAGAASAAADGLAPPRRGRGRLVAGVALAAVVAAVAFFVWRFAPSTGRPAGVAPVARPTVAAPAPPTAPPVGTAAALATPIPAAPPAPVTAPAPVPTPVPTTATPSVKPQSGRDAPVPSAPRPAPRPPRATAEPSFRPPAVLSGLQPLEYPPTPTETPTATRTPTPTATDTATPAAPAPAPGAKPPATPSPRPASSPAVSS